VEASSSFRKNLEPLGPEVRINKWKIMGCEDPLSERRFLSWKFRSPVLDTLDADTLRFRVQRAPAITPACLGISECALEGPALALLTPWAEPIDPGTLDDTSVISIVRDLSGALDALDRHVGYVITVLALPARQAQPSNRRVPDNPPNSMPTTARRLPTPTMFGWQLAPWPQVVSDDQVSRDSMAHGLRPETQRSFAAHRRPTRAFAARRDARPESVPRVDGPVSVRTEARAD